MTELSVVLISKNQEWNIAQLVGSVLKESASLSKREIVLVDSASTDRTTEIAAHFPITVIKLHPDQRLSAAAGRYVGYKRTTGDLVLFLDGDMELCEGWLDQALSVMHSMSDVAVVCGRVIDRPKAVRTSSDGYLESLPADDAGIINVLHGGGAAMYRRSVLERVGTFNPYLYADEEPELCLRIRHAGYQVLRLPRPSVFHYSAIFHALSTFLDKRSSKFFLGFGQNIRYFFGSPLLWPYLSERGCVAPALTLCIGIIAVVALVLTGQWVWLALWGAFLTILTVGIAIRKHSLKRALLTLFGRLLIIEGCVRGLWLKPYDPTSYPGRYDVIQEICNPSTERDSGSWTHEASLEATPIIGKRHKVL
jgi:glycosyltransferase involved in cell wall biosynthesis